MRGERVTVKFTPPTREEFGQALVGLTHEWTVPDGWRQHAVDVESGAPGTVVRVSTTIDVGRAARGKGRNAIDVVMVSKDSGAIVLGRDGGQVAATKVLRTPGWTGRLRERVESLLARSGSLLRCRACGGVMVSEDGVPSCSDCPERLGSPCPKCGSPMRLRSSKRGPFWGCSRYPDCRAARSWTPPTDEDDLDPAELAAARSLLDRVASGAYSQKLRHLGERLAQRLESNPAKALDLILGDATPKGRPTLEVIMRQQDVASRTRKPTRRARPRSEEPADLLEGITLYDPTTRPGEPLVQIEIPEGGGPTAPAADYPHHRLKHETLNPVQSSVLPLVSSDVNLVVAASTSAGKSLVAEMFMGDAIARGGRAIFLSPLRAVSREKYDDWTAEDHPWSDLRVEILTGDYTLTEAKKKSLRRSKVVVMTSEMLDSKTRRMANEQNTWLLQTLCLVVDESHLLTMDGRGDALECGVMRFTRQNPHARVVFLSATMPNVAEMGRWLTHLNGRPSVVVNSAWRPTTLNVHWPTYRATGSYHGKEAAKRDLALDLVVRQHPKDKWIVFVHSKKAGRSMLDDLREAGVEAEFHSADLDRDQRIALEIRFRRGSLRVVVATSTLAYGVNMPARRVFVLGIHRGIEEVDPIDVKQMCGRAGRVGLDPAGDAYVALPQDPYRPRRVDGIRRRFQEIPPIESKINTVDTLAFHLCAEVSEGDVATDLEAVEWHARSLAAFQGHVLEEEGAEVSATNVMQKLERAGILKRSGPRYEATMLGRVSSWLYFSPFDVSDWAGNFRRLSEQDKLRDEDCLAWALGCVRTAYTASYLPRECEGDMADLEWRLRSKGIEQQRLPGPVLAFEGLLTGADYKPLRSVSRGLAHDSRRIVQALKLIDRHVLKVLGDSYLDLVQAKVTYGCSWGEAALCQLPGIGAKRAAVLLKHGIRSIEDVAARRPAVEEAIGRRLAAPAIRRAKELVG